MTLLRHLLCPHLHTTLTRPNLHVTCLDCGKSRPGVLL